MGLFLLRAPPYAQMVKLVDTGDSKSPDFGHEGSIPSLGTKKNYKKRLKTQIFSLFLVNQ